MLLFLNSIGNFGHLSVIIAFMSALFCAYSYYQSSVLFQETHKIPQNSKNTSLQIPLSWLNMARWSFWVHFVAVLAVIASLFDIIYNHRYQYHYAWDHSSNTLPVYYMISCFWEGQEGSFLLWIFWHACLGFFIVYKSQHWETPTMAIFMAVQAFLVSMILGIDFFGMKVGSDPFILMRDAMPDLPIFTQNPDFIPKDGSGLNALLQNYWMVIHPPTLFLGFATTLVPFAYCIAGLWQGEYKKWVQFAFPWALFSAAVLGLGILMGAYWAYETLNFGGYWNWDPVENAVYVPWLFLVASIHVMIPHKTNQVALKSAIVLVIVSFMLILYATFLTRSGILGDASVHSFTDLGLSGQLLLYWLLFLGLSVSLLVFRWSKIPTSEKELSTYNREFWIFMGVLTLIMGGIQVIFATSIPVFNKIAELFGYISNIAMPADQIGYYTKFQLWLGVFVLVLASIGQFNWWKKSQIEKVWYEPFMFPVAISLLFGASAMALLDMTNITFLILFMAGAYSLASNGMILWDLLYKKKVFLAGGAVAHVGVALMLVGILFSSGYSRTVSKNVTGKLYSKEWKTDDNENNVLLWLNQSTPMGKYQLSYKGDYMEAKGFPHFIPKNQLAPVESNENKAIAKQNIAYEGKIYFKKNDTLDIFAENTYYKIDYRTKEGKIFSLFPRGQINPQMGGLLASPDIYKEWDKDLYTHVSSVPDPTKEKEWSAVQEVSAKMGDTLVLPNDYIAVLENKLPLLPDDEIVKEAINSNTNKNVKIAGIKAQIKVLGKDKNYTFFPALLVREDNQLGSVPDISGELGMRIALQKIIPDTTATFGTAQDKSKFVFGVSTTQRDYIIMKAMEKPMINLLWIGSLIMTLGFVMATYRRIKEH